MIAHFDIDAFYASVAQRDDPALRGVPLAVAGSSRRAVVLTASYEARPFGVRSAMPLYRARALCPNLRVVAPDFTAYREASRAVFAIFARRALAVEGLSLDEAYVDLGDVGLDAAVDYATAVRGEVRGEVGLTVSAGIASGKLLAKIASDDAKPDGMRAIPPGDEEAYLDPLAAGRLWGVGPKTAERLAAHGITTIGQIARLDDALAYAVFGRGGTQMRELARGRDDRTVESDRRTRSVSAEETFEYDLPDGPELRDQLHALCEDVARRLEAHDLRGATIGVKVRRSDFATVGRQTSIAHPTRDAALIEATATRCLDRVELAGRAVRLLGVRVASISEEPERTLSLFDPRAVPSHSSVP